MSNFDEQRIRRIVALAESSRGELRQAWSAQAIYAKLDETIIGNEAYKRALSISLSDFLAEEKLRQHLLVAGPSGSGKTYLLEECLPLLGISFHILDASSLVPSGYKGLTLQESLGEFFKAHADAYRRCILILDEFDKLSERANGGDTHKSQSLQSELLTLFHGKQEGPIDTRQALWICAGSFSYAAGMRQSQPHLTKEELLRYGFKNELLGRITKVCHTEIPTVEQVVRRVAGHSVVKSFLKDLKRLGFDVDFKDEAFLKLALAAQNSNFGMRVIGTVISELKEHIVFHCRETRFIVPPELIDQLLAR